ncbi:hypothetical protein [Chryseolinea lacunae]|uniref:Lipoprotein n=1 Tax=Chryseolinea lacunae TaxID=2801331 RepID=A0ABS1KVC4_9BACT|nr:hypothetical protein [Chryseolinea lacunae]MBL0743172.1 hypothetical protein [Chryseolinea lacunae]
MPHCFNAKPSLAITFLLLILIQACSSKKNEVKEEQLRLPQTSADSIAADTIQGNTLRGNLALSQIATIPTSVILTGLDQHRLVTIYKDRLPANASKRSDYDYMYGSKTYYDDDGNSEREEHYMPGLDLLYGYNLVNVAHYDLKTEQLNYLFSQPVLVKSLYYPSFIQDSLYEKPITRNYYLVSVYDTDTNLDTLINRKDLRRFFYFNAAATEKVALLPADYSAVRSQYDPKNDVMYIFAKHDADHDGTTKRTEPLHIFWVDLKRPQVAKRLY